MRVSNVKPLHELKVKVQTIVNDGLKTICSNQSNLLSVFFDCLRDRYRNDQIEVGLLKWRNLQGMSQEDISSLLDACLATTKTVADTFKLVKSCDTILSGWIDPGTKLDKDTLRLPFVVLRGKLRAFKAAMESPKDRPTSLHKLLKSMINSLKKKKKKVNKSAPEQTDGKKPAAKQTPKKKQEPVVETPIQKVQKIFDRTIREEVKLNNIKKLVTGWDAFADNDNDAKEGKPGQWTPSFDRKLFFGDNAMPDLFSVTLLNGLAGIEKTEIMTEIINSGAFAKCEQADHRLLVAYADFVIGRQTPQQFESAVMSCFSKPDMTIADQKNAKTEQPASTNPAAEPKKSESVAPAIAASIVNDMVSRFLSSPAAAPAILPVVPVAPPTQSKNTGPGGLITAVMTDDEQRVSQADPVVPQLDLSSHVGEVQDPQSNSSRRPSSSSSHPVELVPVPGGQPPPTVSIPPPPVVSIQQGISADAQPSLPASSPAPDQTHAVAEEEVRSSQPESEPAAVSNELKRSDTQKPNEESVSIPNSPEEEPESSGVTASTNPQPEPAQHALSNPTSKTASSAALTPSLLNPVVSPSPPPHSCRLIRQEQTQPIHSLNRVRSISSTSQTSSVALQKAKKRASNLLSRPGDKEAQEKSDQSGSGSSKRKPSADRAEAESSW